MCCWESSLLAVYTGRAIQGDVDTRITDILLRCPSKYSIALWMMFTDMAKSKRHCDITTPGVLIGVGGTDVLTNVGDNVSPAIKALCE